MSWMARLAACGAIGVALVALAQPAPPAQIADWAPVDGDAMCAMLARELRGHPVRDLVTVTVSTAVEKRTDTFEVFITPVGVGGGVEGGVARLDLVMGPLHVRSDGSTVRVVHTREAGTVFEAPVEGRSALDVIAEVLPPIPMPQVWMAMSPGDGKCPPLGAYLGDVVWSRAEMTPDGNPPRVRMYGKAEATEAEVEVHAILEPVRIERVVIRDEKDSSTIEIRIEPVEVDALPPEDSMEGRKKVGSVGELVEK